MNNEHNNGEEVAEAESTSANQDDNEDAATESSIGYLLFEEKLLIKNALTNKKYLSDLINFGFVIRCLNNSICENIYDYAKDYYNKCLNQYLY